MRASDRFSCRHSGRYLLSVSAQANSDVWISVQKDWS